MKSSYQTISPETEKQIDFPAETPHDARFAVLLGGRPFDFGAPHYKHGSLLLVIHHEDGRHHVDVSITEDDLGMSDDELMARIIAPCLRSLDSAAYPERGERWMAAMKVYAAQQADSLIRQRSLHRVQ